VLTGWKVTDVKSETNKLKQGIELGKLSIGYLAKKKTRIVEVKIFKTINGWRMLEKLRRIEQPSEK
jgi:hypothetical protein